MKEEQRTLTQQLRQKMAMRLHADIETLVNAGLSELEAAYLLMDEVDVLLEAADQARRALEAR